MAFRGPVFQFVRDFVDRGHVGMVQLTQVFRLALVIA
jgi:hypothetical protein